MDERQGSNSSRLAPGSTRSGRSIGPWHWRTVLAALLALLAVEGQPVAASYATTGPGARAAELVRRTSSPATPALAANVSQVDGTARDGTNESRPDLRLSFVRVTDAEAGQPLSFTIQVRNDGAAASMASVSASVPPELTNVRVQAPGFVCTRRFTPSGEQAGTLVSCLRNDLERGAIADVTIEANAPHAGGSYHLTAVADPRDEVSEADEGNNDANATIHIVG